MSTISNDRIQQIMTRCVPFHGECAAPVSVIEVKAMATELLALRKEREKAEPVAWLICGSKTFKDRTASTREVAEQAVKDRKDGSCIKSLYNAPPAPFVPDGWKMVPVEPTPDMREAFHQANEEWEEGGAKWSPDHQWKAMLSAAPEPCK
ncbi:hypothetical protein SMZ82_002398 [Cronobacter malonaticus]|nr:hypothetical protein [Cronobacter malonaticus]